MSALHWMGLRELFEEFLPVLMNMVLKQKEMLNNSTQVLSVSVSPFDMLYYILQTKPGQSTLATPQMELICIAHAVIAKRQGKELLLNLSAPKRESSEVCRVVFYDAGLFQPGPVLNLAGEAILKFASLPSVDVWAFGDGPVDSKYPPAKDLTDFFRARNRLVILGGNDQGDREVLEKFCPAGRCILLRWMDARGPGCCAECSVPSRRFDLEYARIRLPYAHEGLRHAGRERNGEVAAGKQYKGVPGLVRSCRYVSTASVTSLPERWQSRVQERLGPPGQFHHVLPNNFEPVGPKNDFPVS